MSLQPPPRPCWPLRRFQALRRPGDLSGHRPSCQCCRETTDTRTGQENCAGGHWRRREQGRDGGRGRGRKPTEAIVTGFCRRPPQAQTPPFSLSQPPCLNLSSQLKNETQSSPPWPSFGSSCGQPCLASPPGSSRPSLGHPISWEASPCSAQRWGSAPSWRGEKEGDKPKPHPLQNQCKKYENCSISLTFADLGISFFRLKGVGRKEREKKKKKSVWFLLHLSDNIVPT